MVMSDTGGDEGEHQPQDRKRPMRPELVGRHRAVHRLIPSWG